MQFNFPISFSPRVHAAAEELKAALRDEIHATRVDDAR